MFRLYASLSHTEVNPDFAKIPVARFRGSPLLEPWLTTRACFIPSLIARAHWTELFKGQPVASRELRRAKRIALHALPILQSAVIRPLRQGLNGRRGEFFPQTRVRRCAASAILADQGQQRIDTDWGSQQVSGIA